MFDRDVSFRVTEALFHSFRKSDEGHEEEGPGVEGTAAPITITVSREAGDFGKIVADEIGRQLGWPVYDREILEKVAEDVRHPASHLEGVDERPVNWLEDCLTGLMTRYRISATSYLRHLIGVVRGLGLIGRCVLVGRGAHHILPAATTLRIRVISAMPDRIKATMERHRMSEKEAARHLNRIDRERTEFVKANFHFDPAAPEQYDLVLNSSRLSVAECASTVIEVLHLVEKRAAARKTATAKLAGASAN
jgi:hypothetical protein